jgi:hypothetical protein
LRIEIPTTHRVHPLGDYDSSDRACVAQIGPMATRRLPRARMPEAALVNGDPPRLKKRGMGRIAWPAWSWSKGGAAAACPVPVR